MRGDVKSMLVYMTPDLNKIVAKKPKSNLPPKPKYVIETLQIKQIVKGHGTEAFKKSKGFFRKSNLIYLIFIILIVPPAEKCFTIFGPTTAEGVSCLNIECENEEDVNKWLDDIEVVINHYKKIKSFKSNFVIRK
jgi:hypothetical protein